MTDSNNSTKSQLDVAMRQIKEDIARAALAKIGANVRLLLPHVRDQISLEFVRGAFEPRVLDDKGEARLGIDNKPMTIDSLLAEMRSDGDFGAAFAASAKSPGKGALGSGRA